MESVPGRIGDVVSDRAELWLRRRQERRNPLFCTKPEMRFQKSYDNLTIILRSPYDNLMIVLRSFYDHLTIILLNLMIIL
jgi:hypothetical protein